MNINADSGLCTNEKEILNPGINIAIVGGDVRQSAVAGRLHEAGMNVIACGIGAGRSDNDCFSACEDYKNAVKNCVAVVLPLPASTDGVYINTPLVPEMTPIRLTALLDEELYGDKKPIILGGKLTPAFKAYAVEKGFRVIDYYENEILQIKNALPTAEGALEIAMRVLQITIHSSQAAVVGYGRIAKTLSKMLLAMNANVTVAARKGADLAYAELCGCKTLKIAHTTGKSTLCALGKGYDVIFNTVPYWVFDRDVISEMNRDTVLIDLASAPGGFDINALNDYGINVIRAVSLPGKCAPVTAGKIIGDTVLNILHGEGVIV